MDHRFTGSQASKSRSLLANGADFDPATLHNWPEEGPRLAALARNVDVDSRLSMAISLKLAAPPSDEEIVEISERNPGFKFERSAAGSFS